MAFRFNSGVGGVTCGDCNVLFDEGLSYSDYMTIYKRVQVDGKDLCWECKEKRKRPGDEADLAPVARQDKAGGF